MKRQVLVPICMFVIFIIVLFAMGRKQKQHDEDHKQEYEACYNYFKNSSFSGNVIKIEPIFNSGHGDLVYIHFKDLHIEQTSQKCKRPTIINDSTLFIEIDKIFTRNYHYHYFQIGTKVFKKANSVAIQFEHKGKIEEIEIL